MKKLFLLSGLNTKSYEEVGEDIIAESKEEAIAMFKEMHNEAPYLVQCDYLCDVK